MEAIQLILSVILVAAVIIGIINVVVIAGYQTVNGAQIIFKEEENSVTFIGHGTTLIRLNNTNILTDPNFNDWVIILHRSREAGLKIQNLPKIDAIVISHAHRDHLDEWTLRQLPKDVPVLISKGNGDLVRSLGFSDVQELNPEDSVAIRTVQVTAKEAKHSGSRNSSFADYPKALSYVIEGSKTVYFAGDTGLFDGFREIGSHYKIDVALLPIGAYRPRMFLMARHMNPEDALLAMKMLGAKEMIPIHWGSFRMAMDGTDEPKEVLLKLIENNGVKDKIHILENGEKYVLNYRRDK